MKGEEATRGWEAGLIASGLSLLLEALGRNNPLTGLYGALTHFLGTPEAFNLLHRLLGYGEAAKALAFLAALGLFLLLHRLLWGLPYLLLALYLALAGPWGLLSGLWLLLPRGWPAGRRRVLGLGLLALATLLLGRRRGSSRKESALPLLGQEGLYQVSKNPPFLDPDLRGRPYRLEVEPLGPLPGGPHGPARPGARPHPHLHLQPRGRGPGGVPALEGGFPPRPFGTGRA